MLIDSLDGVCGLTFCLLTPWGLGCCFLVCLCWVFYVFGFELRLRCVWILDDYLLLGSVVCFQVGVVGSLVECWCI